MTLDTFTPNVQLSEFALRLRKYRQENGLSFGEAAHRLGVTLERFGTLELDRAQPTVRERRRLERLIARSHQQKTASPE